jgi:hypothetical protein
MGLLMGLAAPLMLAKSIPADILFRFTQAFCTSWKVLLKVQAQKKLIERMCKMQNLKISCLLATTS